MILFLSGTPGVGKSRLAAHLREDPAFLHLEFDRLRLELGAQTTTNPAVEDAINWRAYTRAIDFLGTDMTERGRHVIIDSTGISRRLPYLRQALADYDQLFLRLLASFPYALCAKKWGSSYSQEQFNHIAGMVMSLETDYDVHVDGKSADQLAGEVRTLLGLG
jgi:predicted kinase